MELPAGTVGGLIVEINKTKKLVVKDIPCVFDGLGEGLYYMFLNDEKPRRYFAYQNNNFTEPFGKAWFSDSIKLSYTNGQGITVTQSNYNTIIITICRVS